MLTDIFATRYADRQLWNTFSERERVLLVQCFRNVSEQVMPYWQNGKVDEGAKKHWAAVESQLSMELGLEHLHPHTYGYWGQQKNWISGSYTLDKVCSAWMLAEFKAGTDPDRYMKNRISFVELAFRTRDEWLKREENNTEFWIRSGVTTRIAERERQKQVRDAFRAHCDELNERFRQAKVPLHYHNGFVQFTADEMTEMEIVQPFWRLVAAEKWENVSIDMAEAVDRRDTGGRDPAFYAAKALESTIKIISDEKGWTRNTEKGAANFIDNLVAERNGARFIDVWEKELLLAYFGKVRNQLGHGPGGEPMPNLTAQQTTWAIESAMSWCKSLIERT